MRKGFTIIELLIVIAVISILVGIALPRFKGMRDEGNIAKAKGELRTLQTAIESYRIHNGAYPAAAGWQTTLLSAKPQIISAAMVDPFGLASAQYVLVLSNDTTGHFYAIYSVGPVAGASVTAVDDITGVATESAPTCIYVSNGTPDTTP
ncbi:MAG: type II secretion system protein [Candidatus Omnitrophica bacterium]|nr:type II secretion system protein [Candidatus Omnitrophota bacterium]